MRCSRKPILASIDAPPASHQIPGSVPAAARDLHAHMANLVSPDAGHYSQFSQFTNRSFKMTASRLWADESASSTLTRSARYSTCTLHRHVCSRAHFATNRSPSALVLENILFPLSRDGCLQLR